MIAAENISVTRGGRKILDSVSLAARAGEFIAVIGPNGAGKSTLLSVLAGLLKPDAGSVTLDGTALRDIAPSQLARARAYLPQNPHLEWPLPVERLVALGLTPHLPALGGLPRQWQPAITRALEMCDLAGRRDQPATTLSGGEFARAMLARAIVGDPAILIVDEPIAGLDPYHAMQTMALLSRLAKGGKLVIASLHDLTLAARHAGRIIAIANGRVAGDGPVLTQILIRTVFAVESRISGSGADTMVDFLAP
jgi:iron complex transport system ATP-binding protein